MQQFPHPTSSPAAARARRTSPPLTFPRHRRHWSRPSPSIQWPHGSRARGNPPRPRVAEGGVRAPARARRALHHDLRASRSSPSIPTRTWPRTTRERDIGYPGDFPFTRGRLPVDVPRAAVDHAPVRRLRHRRGDQRALPLPARPRPDRPLDGVRHADADGPRLRQRALARRGRPRGRRDRHARRHGDAVPAASRWARSRLR